MRHLKIFEKFESKKLSRVLDYISKSSKSKFLSDIKKICDNLDYPISELSDDKFEYMRFSDAFKLKDSDGKKYLKFWFNLEGEYIGITKFTTPIKNDNEDLENYDVDRSIDYAALSKGYSKIEELPHLQKVAITISGREMLATIWKENHRYYAIQNKCRGDAPRKSLDWDQYGSNSWFLGGDDHGSIFKATKNMNGNSLVDNRPPEEFNIPCDTSLRLKLGSIKEFLKNADFSLILDINSVKNPVKTIRKKQQERVINKTDVLAHKTEDQIKKENIERYLHKLSDYKSSNLDEVKKIVLRLYGWDSPMYFVWFGTNDTYFRDITSYIYTIIKSPKSIDTYSRYISDCLKVCYKTSSDKYTMIKKNIKLCKEKAKKENDQDMVKFLDLYDKLNLTIKNFLMRGKMSTISDLELMSGKVRMIRHLMRESTHGLYRIEYFIDQISKDTKCYDSVNPKDSHLIEGMENIISTLSNF